MALKKTVAFSIPCFNEKDNVVPMAEQLMSLMDNSYPEYDYNIQFIDNHSDDGTRDILRDLCKKYPKVRAILNAKNYPMTSGYHGILSAQGDCVISIPADFQIPIDTVPKLISEWKNGSKVVCLQKTATKSNKLMWAVRQLYYKTMQKFSEGEILKNFTGSGLYDKSFLDFCRASNNALPNFISMVQVYGFDMATVPYVEEKRKSGKSKNGFFSLAKIGVNRFINASNMLPKIAVWLGFIIAFISAVIGLVYLILKLVFWDNFIAGMAPVLIGVFFMGSVQLFFIGVIGLYIMKLDKRSLNAPLVAEEERLNFDK